MQIKSKKYLYMLLWGDLQVVLEVEKAYYTNVYTKLLFI